MDKLPPMVKAATRKVQAYPQSGGGIATVSLVVVGVSKAAGVGGYDVGSSSRTESAFGVETADAFV